MNTLHSAAVSGDLDLVRQLLAEGADVEGRNESTWGTPLIAACLSPHAGPEIMEILLDHGADIHARAKRSYEDEEPLIALAVTDAQASCDKIRLLIQRGADIQYRSTHGYTLLTRAVFRNDPNLIDLLTSLGAPLDGESVHRESALSVLSRLGRFEEIAKLLALGADPSPLGWTPLHRSVALGTLEDVRAVVEQGAGLESSDFWERTPLLLSIQTGDTEKVALLLASGADRNAKGRCGKPPAFYPIGSDDSRMMQWLVDEGFDPYQQDDFGASPLEEAVEESAVACFQVLLNAGVWKDKNRHGDSLIRNASHPEIIRALIGRGADLAHLERDILRKWIGLETSDGMTVDEEEFSKNRTRRFGTDNPQKMEVPFWRAMVRNGWEGYHAASHFGAETFDRENPVWCHHRWGMSLTALPDGRFIQIAGEHEDGYDPDFCIYNDVLIHDGKGGFEILGYPQEIFPPTDFHSATLVGEWIYIIGNLGYPETGEAHGHETPVYRFHVTSGKIERVIATGTSPGWIHSHDAVLIEGARIRISGGKKYSPEEDSSGRIQDHTGIHLFHLESGSWQLLNP